MKVLIACEESQAVTKEFRRLGHTAYSCDILPCSGGHPEWHLQMDVFEAYRLRTWDFVISFPPCTDLTVSGARWFEDKRKSGDQERSIEFFFKVWEISDIVENPIGVLNKRDYILKWFPDLYHRMDAMGFPFKPSQIIQPWQFGHGETKATCLWIREGLP